MAKTLAFKRSTSQVVTVDTVNNLIAPLGPALLNIASTTGTFPAKVQNTTGVYKGDSYALVVTTAGKIEVWKHSVSTNTWALSSPSIGPSVVTLTVNSIVGVFSVGNFVTAGAATGQLSNVSGSTFVVQVISGTFPNSGALTNTSTGGTANIVTNTPGVQVPHCVQVVNDKFVAVWTESSGSNSVASAIVFDGTSWSSRVNSGTTLLLDGNVGGPSIVWRQAVWFATKAGIGHFIPGTGFGSFDVGTDTIANPLADSICTQGAFAYWNNSLYFVRPDNGTGAGIRFYTLNPLWSIPAPAPPQWSVVTGVTGVSTSGNMTSANDVGTYCLFVNKRDELCLWHSGQSQSRLVKSSATTFPTFTDITADSLPSELSSKTDVGVSIYVDSRRRLNELHWFLVRDSGTADSVTLCRWDAVNPVEVLFTFSGSDLLVSSGEQGDIRTYTGVQPACYITNVNTTSAPAFPGRAVITYTVKDTLARNVDVIGEFSIDGDEWRPMTQGAGDDGAVGLATSPSGTSHTFYWDAFADLDGTYEFMHVRMIAKISVATNEAAPNRFVAIIEEGYLKPPVTRGQSTHNLVFNGGTLSGTFVVGETVTGLTSGTTGVVQYASGTNIVLTGVVGSGFQPGSPGEFVQGTNGGVHSARIASVAQNIITTETLPADETTDLEQFHAATSTVNRAHVQNVFQGRLSTNQTKIRSIKLTMRASNIAAQAKVSVFVSGQGPNNQYVAGPYSSFQALSTANTEVIINDIDLLNQPSALGKHYMVVVEFDLGNAHTAMVSTPFFRHE